MSSHHTDGSLYASTLQSRYPEKNYVLRHQESHSPLRYHDHQPTKTSGGRREGAFPPPPSRPGFPETNYILQESLPERRAYQPAKKNPSPSIPRSIYGPPPALYNHPPTFAIHAPPNPSQTRPMPPILFAQSHLLEQPSAHTHRNQQRTRAVSHSADVPSRFVVGPKDCRACVAYAEFQAIPNNPIVNELLRLEASRGRDHPNTMASSRAMECQRTVEFLARARWSSLRHSSGPAVIDILHLDNCLEDALDHGQQLGLPEGTRKLSVCVQITGTREPVRFFIDIDIPGNCNCQDRQPVIITRYYLAWRLAIATMNDIFVPEHSGVDRQRRGLFLERLWMEVGDADGEDWFAQLRYEPSAI
ncbi:hypothetical protein C8F01DRAFT_1252634 [Mycena amicta]|nr:hypothetical protein C8F01DRAFT_1252634 [Mycena amicta]